jgi:hypothetical protein
MGQLHWSARTIHVKLASFHYPLGKDQLRGATFTATRV